jgi:hypothetical protein
MKNPAAFPKADNGAGTEKRPVYSHGARGLSSTGISGRLARCLLRIKRPRVPLPEARGHVKVAFAAPAYEGTQD